jgi:hypothetical protein
MLQVIQYAQAQHDVEGPDARGIQLVNLHPAIIRAGAENAVKPTERVQVHVVHRSHFRAAPLHLKCKESVPGADVEHPLAGQVLRQAERGQPVQLPLEAHRALQHGTIGEPKAVVETGLVEFSLDRIHPALFEKIGARLHGLLHCRAAR